MNIAQALTDIQMLLTYIKEHVQTELVARESVKLDELAKTLLGVKTGLESLLAADTSKELDKEAALQTQLDSLTLTLSDVITALTNNQESEQALLGKVEERYVACAETLARAEKKQELQMDAYTEQMKQLMNELQNAVTATADVKEKLADADILSGELTALGAKIDTIEAADKQLNKTYIENAHRLDSLVEQIQTEYHALNQTLVSLDESFRTAVSRLDVLLVQAEQLGRGQTV